MPRPFRKLVPLLTVVSILSVLLVACHPHRTEATFFIFGTMVELTLIGDEAAVNQAITAIHAEFRAMHRDLHAWKPGPLVDFNACLRTGASCSVPPAVAAVLPAAIEWSDRSGGLFDPAVGGLVGAWGFHRDEFPITEPPPSAALLSRLLHPRPTVADLNFDAATRMARTSNRNLQLDFGGLAKGIAVDRAVAIARRHGISNLIANAGGDLRAIGRNGEQPWRIAIRHAFGDGALAGIEIRHDEAIFTSGVYQRYLLHEGERYPHLIDPRDGQPVAELLSATVIADEGAAADAAATALVVAGLDAWRTVASKMGIEQAMVVDEQGRVLTTAAMAARLIDVTPGIEIVVVD